MLSLTLITFIYDNNLTLRSSLKDAYHMLSWAQKLNIPYTWYVDRYSNHLLLDPAMNSFLTSCPKQFITNEEQLCDIMHNIKSYTLCCISAHGTTKGLLYNNQEYICWYKLYHNLIAPHVILLIDCCHVVLPFPWLYYNNNYHNNDNSIIMYPAPYTYILTACNNENIARYNADGSYLINHFLKLYEQNVYHLANWQKSFNKDYALYYLRINNNVIMDQWLPLWLFNKPCIIMDNFLLYIENSNKK